MPKIGELISSSLSGLVDAYATAARTLIAPVVNVKGYGAVGDGTTDDTASMQAAFAALSALGGGTVYIPRTDHNYILSGTVPLCSNLCVISDGATLEQTAADTAVLQGDGIETLRIEGLAFEGYGADYDNASNSTTNIANAIHLIGTELSSDVTVRDCRFNNFGYAAIYFDNVEDFRIEDNIIVGTGNTSVPAGGNYQFGISISTHAARGVIAGNDISGTAQGIITAKDFKDLTIAGNTIHDIPGQHGMYLGQGDNLVVMGNLIRAVNYQGIKLQQEAVHTSISQTVVIANNAVYDTGSHGILITNTDPAQTYNTFEVTVTGNVINRSTDVTGDAGIDIISVHNVIVANNVVRGGGFGVYASNVTDAAIQNNYIHHTNRTGIHLTGADSARVHIERNIVRNPGQANIAGVNCGIYINRGATVIVDGNRVSDSEAIHLYGIFVVNDPTSTSDVHLRNNVCSGSSSNSIRFNTSATAIAEFHNNMYETLGNYGAFTLVEGRKARVYHGTQAPATGTYVVGDLCYNTAPAAGSRLGWVCTVAGTPGTWVAFGEIVLTGSASWDPGSLADGAGETSPAITVTGAALGDYVLVAAPYDLQGITCNAYVSAANTVKIRLQNETGGVIDLASGTWNVRIVKA
jgi:hypothetical protein